MEDSAAVVVSSSDKSGYLWSSSGGTVDSIVEGGIADSIVEGGRVDLIVEGGEGTVCSSKHGALGLFAVSSSFAFPSSNAEFSMSSGDKEIHSESELKATSGGGVLIALFSEIDFTRTKSSEKTQVIP